MESFITEGQRGFGSLRKPPESLEKYVCCPFAHRMSLYFRSRLQLRSSLSQGWTVQYFRVSQTGSRAFAACDTPRTPTDINVRPIDEVARVGKQENSGICDLLDQPKPLHGHAPDGFVSVFGPKQAAHAFGAGDGPGGNDVGSDTFGPIFDGDAVRECIDPSLGRAYMGLCQPSIPIVRRGDKDEPATGAVGS